MMHDYISYSFQNAQKQLEDLKRQEKIIKEARGVENKSRRTEAEKKAEAIRETLMTGLPPAAVYEFLDVTNQQENTAVDFRTHWQKRNLKVDCLRKLTKEWKWAKGNTYYKQAFETPKVDLDILPFYSFVIQFTFTLAQPYISRDEQDFYIIDNPVRKDKIFGMPYVASTSWKGSLRAAIRQLEHVDKSRIIKDEIDARLFGNDKGEQDQEKFHAGSLFFFPTFFTQKSLEIINPQDRKLRAGKLPILFESAPQGTTGIFTLLYVPFNRVGEDAKETSDQVATDLMMVVKGLHAMFCIYGFGAKTHSGFGVAKEIIQKTSLEVHVAEVQKITETSISFEQLIEAAEKLTQKLRSSVREV